MGFFGERRRWRSKNARKDGPRTGPDPALFALLRAVVILMFGILVIQLINLQVIKGADYQERAEINALREVSVPAARGLVFDRNGRPLVENTARFAAAIIPGDLPDRGEVGLYRQLSSIINVPVEDIQAKVDAGRENQGDYSPAVIKPDIDRDTALVLMELEPHAPGLKVMVQPARQYVSGGLLSHVLGYVGPISAEEYAQLQSQGYGYQDVIGKTGVEASYERRLRGTPGKKLIEVDAAGRELRTISERPPVDGENLYLSIDVDLQKEVADVLQPFAEDSQNAAAVVMDVHTGSVLAMVSLPSFDNNVFSRPLTEAGLSALVDSPGKPLVNHAIAERYPPGSTFKTIVGAGALQEGIASPYTTINSRGYITVENEFDPNVVYVYPDWSALGPLDFYGGIAMSSNVYFYYLAGGKPDEGFKGLGEDRVAQYARDFGLGSPTGIDLPGESSGLVPDAQWKLDTVGDPWTLGDTYNFGIGQGYVAATPLQMLCVASVIANGGTLLTPHVVQEYRDSHGNVLSAYQEKPRSQVPVDPSYLQVLRDAMRQGVTSGVAKNAAIAGVDVAGKTGTAEFGPDLGGGKHDTHGWFIGFAPYDDPQIAIAVFVQRGGGGNDASPVASKILDYYYHGPRLASASLEAAKPEGTP